MSAPVVGVVGGWAAPSRPSWSVVRRVVSVFVVLRLSSVLSRPVRLVRPVRSSPVRPANSTSDSVWSGGVS